MHRIAPHISKPEKTFQSAFRSIFEPFSAALHFLGIITTFAHVHIAKILLSQEQSLCKINLFHRGLIVLLY